MKFEIKNIINPIIVILGSILLFSTLFYDINIYDEGMVVTNAKLILSGITPYKGFWTIYAPGQYYLVALFFGLFGKFLIVERILSAVIILGISYFGYKISSEIKASSGIFVFIIFSLLFAYTGFGRAVSTFLLLNFSAIFLLIKYKKSQKLLYVFLSGCLLGLAGFFRHDMALYIGFSLILALAANSYVFKIADSHGKKSFIIFATSFLLFYSLSIITIIFIGGFQNVYQQMVLAPSELLSAFRSLPFPNPFHPYHPSIKPARALYDMMIYLTPFVVFLVSAFKLYKLNKEKYTPHFTYLFSIILFNGAFFLIQTTIRKDLEHILPALMFSSILLLFYATNSRKMIAKLALVLLLIIPVLNPLYSKIKILRSKDYVKIESGSLSGIKLNTSLGNQYLQINKFLQSNLNPNDPIYIGVKQHNKVLLNDIMLYFYLGRSFPCKFYELHPGMINKEATQRTIVDCLDSQKIKYIVEYYIKDFNEPNKTSLAIGSSLLDNYISSNYTICNDLGDYLILKRNAY